MKSKIFLLIIMLILGSSFASAGLWDWLTGLVTGNETILPQTIYVDKAESFSLRVGDTAIFLISGHERKITLTQINGDTAYVIYNYKANTGEQYTETTSINIGEIYIPDASYKINSLLMNDTSANFMFETFPSLPLPELDEGCTTIARSAIFDAERHWENLGLDTSQHSEIKHYRIRWFNGYWSRWYEAGFDDKDWKVNGDGSRRRVWSYFRDHYHQYVECAEAEPEPEPGVYSCSDSDGGTDLDVAGTVTISVSNGTASETVDDICSSNGMLTERYCTSAGGVATFANYYYDCPQGCSNGACINETEPEENISCSSNSDCPETSHQNSPYFCSGNDILKNYFSYECANPGTPESYCDESIEPRVINSCVDGASYCVELHSSCYSLNNLITNDILCSDTAYECPAGCLTVACTANETESGVYSCSDSDGGTDLDVAGTITISVSNGTASETVDDICSSNGMLTERYCTSAGGIATFANYYYDCPQGCSNGACINETNQTGGCSDSDGGIYYDVAGTVTISVSNGTVPTIVDDYCSSNGVLTERYCTGSDYGWANSPYTCPNGCSSGACVEEQLNETNQTVNCYGNVDCGDSGFTGSHYCNGNSIYRNFIGGVCINPETFDSYCNDSTVPILIAECFGDNYCINGQPECYTSNASNVSVDVQMFSPPEAAQEIEDEAQEAAEVAELTEECNGCVIDEACVNFGYRYSGQYCNIDKTFFNQKAVNATCENHFECDNNLCLDSECVSGNLVFMQKFFMWLKTLLGVGS